MLAEVAERHAVRDRARNQAVGGARDQDLAAMRRGRDPGGAVDVEARVVVATERPVSGVDAHPDADRGSVGPGLGRERTLGGDGAPDRVAGGPEHDEELVTLGPDLDAASIVERPPKERVVAVQQLGETGTEGRGEAGGALHVREQERHRPRREPAS